jgi:hypothetical protein
VFDEPASREDADEERRKEIEIQLQRFGIDEIELTKKGDLEDIHEQGWTRVDTAPNEWVALVPNEDNSAFGGTLWKRGENGIDYSEGCTAAHPISAALGFEAAARAVAVLIKKENAG